MQETASVVSAPIPCLACICPSQPQRGLKQLIGREPQSHPIRLPLTQKALPACNIVCITGAEMKAAVSNYLQVLYEADPAAVGGNLPDDAFYYEAD